MDQADLSYVKACSLAGDTVSSYDPRQLFDDGYIEEGWSLMRENLKQKSLNTLSYALHAVADFYAHSSYAQFAPREPGERALVLYDETAPIPLRAEYNVEPFNLNDTDR